MTLKRAVDDRVEQYDKRRGTSPEAANNRRLFGELLEILHRYSYSIDEMTDKQVKEFLDAEVKKLSKADPLIDLKLQLKKMEGRLEEKDLRVGSYRLESPSLKTLNDYYLGIEATNDFINELHKEIIGIFEGKAEILNTFYKGGFFLMDLSDIKVPDDFVKKEGSEEDIKITFLREKLNVFQAKITDIFRGHVEERLNKLFQDLSEKNALVKKMVEEMDGQTLDIMRAVIRGLMDEKENLGKSLYQLHYLIDEILKGKTLQITFGVNALESRTDNKELCLSILNSERGANKAAVRKYFSDEAVDSERRGLLQEFSYSYFFGDLLKIQSKTVGKIYFENGESNDEGWNEFFEVNETGNVVMNRKMIGVYRKLGEFKKDGEYSKMSMAEQKKFDEKMAYFERFYKITNASDVLKNFRTVNFDHYSRRVDSIVDLVGRAEVALGSENPDGNALRGLLRETTEQLELSLKDEGQGITRTMRAFIKQLMQPGRKIIIVGDHSGFGSFNIEENEKSMLELIRLISDEEVAKLLELMIHEGGSPKNHKAFNEGIQECVTRLVAKEGFADKILSIGDSGTEYLRKKEAEIFNRFPGIKVSSGDGGDELLMAVILEGELSKEELENLLQELASTHRVRITAVMTNDFQLPKIKDLDSEGLGSQNREKINSFIREFMAWSEDAQNKIKIREAGPQKVGKLAELKVIT